MLGFAQGGLAEERLDRGTRAEPARALILSVRPDLGARDVVQIVRQGAVDVGDPGRDDQTGDGRVDFKRSLDLAQAWPRRGPATTPGTTPR